MSRLNIEELRWVCPTNIFSFNTLHASSENLIETNKLPSSSSSNVGQHSVQQRALEAIKLGVDMKSPGYNIFVSGLEGTQSSNYLKEVLASIIAERVHKKLMDQLFIYNFKKPESPKYLTIPAGQGHRFKSAMQKLVENLKSNLPKIYESEAYQNKKKQLMESSTKKAASMVQQFEQKLAEKNFTLVPVQLGPVKKLEILLKVDPKNTTNQGGKSVISLVELENLLKNAPVTKQSSQALENLEIKKKQHQQFMEELSSISKEIRKLEKSLEKAIEELDRVTVKPYVIDLVKDIQDSFSQLSPEINQYLESVLEFIMNNCERFLPEKEKDSDNILSSLFGGKNKSNKVVELEVNLAVSNLPDATSPIIIETFPTYNNLFGFVDVKISGGLSASSDHMSLRAGSLLKANGGFLILYCKDVLTEVGSWQTLMRTLRSGQVEIQNYSDSLGLALNISSKTIKPDPIPIDVKVVMIGDSRLFTLLSMYEDNFANIFKVKAEFDYESEISGETIRDYVNRMKNLIKKEDLKPLDRSAVSTLFEQGVRLTSQKNKLSTSFHILEDIIREANYWANKEGSNIVSESHVDKAIDERTKRVNLPEEKLQERITEGTIMIELEGKKVGQINGLSVYVLGDHSFGKPSKVTCITSCGKTGILDIEREVKFAGNIYNKGSYIISAYMKNVYAQESSIEFSASICFEQSYGPIDGDSASSTELYALLSSLSGLPIRQDIAVTGSVNQKGEVQPIGGANEKIEGFFDVCKSKGLTGTQGVMIPHLNVKNLQLRKDVVKAVKQQQFHIYSVKTIDEGIELLTGVPAGKLKAGSSSFEENTVHGLVQQKLHQFKKESLSQRDVKAKL